MRSLKVVSLSQMLRRMSMDMRMMRAPVRDPLIADQLEVELLIAGRPLITKTRTNSARSTVIKRTLIRICSNIRSDRKETAM